MGSHNETCMISNLPIKYGDKAYLLLLTETPYAYKKGQSGCYTTDHWFLRSIPISGTYNDYGKLEVLSEDWSQEATLQQFQHDLVEELVAEEHWGKTSILKTKLSFDNLQTWLHEGRLEVESKTAVGLPRLKVVKAFIRKDVWDMMLGMVVKGFAATSMEKMKKDLRSYVDIISEVKDSAAHKTIPEHMIYSALNLRIRAVWHENDFLGPFVASPGIGATIGGSLRFHKQTIDDKFLKGEIDAEQAEQTYLSIAEVIHVQCVMEALRKGWHPTIGSGSQDANFELAMQFNLGLAAISYENLMSGLSEQNGFCLEDFQNLPEDFDQTSLKYMMEVASDKELLKTKLDDFRKQVVDIDVRIEGQRSNE